MKAKTLLVFNKNKTAKSSRRARVLLLGRYTRRSALPTEGSLQPDRVQGGAVTPHWSPAAASQPEPQDGHQQPQRKFREEPPGSGSRSPRGVSLLRKSKETHPL